MALGLEVLVGGIGLLLLLPTTVLFAEVLLAVAGRERTAVAVGERSRLAILMPAHDEALGISQTIATISPELRVGDRLIVVADNCTDETATIASAVGAEVVIRHDLTHRGKGYALDFGLRYLAADAPAVVVIIDADCRVAAGAIDTLARACVQSGQPVQALYLMQAHQPAGPRMRIAEFAWAVKNQVRPSGLYRLGLPCQLMGTGMAFPWPCIMMANLATGHIVEDLKLGIELARAGSPPLFCPQALVTSKFPTSSDGVQSQRTRWEHGHLSLIFKEAPRLFAHSLAARDMRSMVMALDLSVPPLALLTLIAMVDWVAALLMYLLTKTLFPLAITSIVAVTLTLSVMLSWRVYGRHIVSLGGLAFAAIHALLKIPLYVRFIVARQSKWVRSKRDADPSGRP